MAKLGYTFYPKDWGNSDCVFELNLSERGLYRELIDLAMLNDNKTEYKPNIWARKFGSSIDEINEIIDRLIGLNIVIIKENILFIPSCEKRLVFVRTGRKGGQKSIQSNKGNSKGNSKGISKGMGKGMGKGIGKGMSNQREREREIENKKETTPTAEAIDFNLLLKAINETFNRGFTKIPEVAKKKYRTLLKNGYSKQCIINAILNVKESTFHKENAYQYCTPEF
ncbi:MAG: hypothetical protein RQ756_08735, partial [Flavobacteriaceae bacterium]|nr:hypothetical protein [Flavobacteriaceae bacterium]